MSRKLLIALAVAAGIGAFAAPLAKPPDAAEILRRAEDVRNPRLDYAVNLTIRTISGDERIPEYLASYSLLARGQDHSLILMRTPESFYGGLLLIAEGRHWMLLPRATKPLELAPVQVLAGDVSNGDLARANLLRGYTARLAGEEQVDGEPCYRLELTETDRMPNYPRIVYWVAKKRFLPRKMELYGRTERLLKTVQFGDYRSEGMGLRPMRLEVQATDRAGFRSTVVFSKLRQADASKVSFTPEAMLALRASALAARESGKRDDLPLEELVRGTVLRDD